MNNTPAFPIPRHTRHFDNIQGDYVQDDGMTLRDYFAAEAISFIQWNKDHTELCAKKCYEIADAMMKAREA
jgi:hypothetical protein